MLPAVALLVALLVAIAFAVLVGGEVAYTPAQAFDVLWHQRDSSEWNILAELRLPRTLCAALVGAALALSGVLMQGLFRNALASPGILGATSGGTFAAVVAISIGLSARSIWWIPAASFLGSTFAIVVVYLLAGRGPRLSTIHLILGGVAVNTLFSAGASLVLTLTVHKDEITRQIVRWLTGGLQSVGWSEVAFLLPCVGISLLGSVFVARDLNLVLLGEESAYSLGVRLARLKRRTIVLAALATGAAVSAAGMVGFVGLVAPHIVRFLLGPDHRRLVLTGTLFGGLLLVLADLVSVSILSGRPIQLGIVTSLVGGPFFLFLIVRERQRGEGGSG